jgi:hypothetical protein
VNISAGSQDGGSSFWVVWWPWWLVGWWLVVGGWWLVGWSSVVVGWSSWIDSENAHQERLSAQRDRIETTS